jgi:hypothetical protein
MPQPAGTEMPTPAFRTLWQQPMSVMFFELHGGKVFRRLIIGEHLNIFLIAARGTGAALDLDRSGVSVEDTLNVLGNVDGTLFKIWHGEKILSQFATATGERDRDISDTTG